MQRNSRPVSTNQRHLHPKLALVVHRHLQTVYRAVPAAHNRQAYEGLTRALIAQPRPLVLDSFCGTGHSTATLAEQYPGHLVVGIDKSARRLEKHPGGRGDNYLLLRADCEDIWNLLVRDGLAADFHYMLYPNPWPKPGQLKRRWHGHPVFPTLLKLGGRLEMRCNWDIYATEFAFAVQFATGLDVRLEQSSSSSITTPFERKYRNSGHQIFTVTTPELPGEPAIPQALLPAA